MKAGHKFLLGASLIVASVGFLIAEGVKETGVYFLTPSELAEFERIKRPTATRVLRRHEEDGLIERAARVGKPMILSTGTSSLSEVEETLGVCDRVLVLYKGRIIREFARGEATKADVMHWVAGGVIPTVEQVQAVAEEDPRLAPIRADASE